MGDVIDWPIRPFNPKAPQDYDNLGPCLQRSHVRR